MAADEMIDERSIGMRDSRGTWPSILARCDDKKIAKATHFHASFSPTCLIRSELSGLRLDLELMCESKTHLVSGKDGMFFGMSSECKWLDATHRAYRYWQKPLLDSARARSTLAHCRAYRDQSVRPDCRPRAYLHGPFRGRPLVPRGVRRDLINWPSGSLK